MRCNKVLTSTGMLLTLALFAASSQASFLEWTQDTSATLESADPSNFKQTVTDLCGSGKLQICRQQQRATEKGADAIQRYTITFGDSCQPLDIIGTRFYIQPTKLLTTRQLEPAIQGATTTVAPDTTDGRGRITSRVSRITRPTSRPSQVAAALALDTMRGRGRDILVRLVSASKSADGLSPKT